MSLSVAVSQFLYEFEILNTRYVRLAVQSLIGDLSLVEQAQTKLELHARLTLVKRIAMGRPATRSAVQEIERIIEGTSQLSAKHEELTQNLRTVAQGKVGDPPGLPNSLPTDQRLWVPTEDEISDCNAQTVKLQQSLQALTETFRHG